MLVLNDDPPVRRGWELLAKWVTYWNNGENTAQGWWDMGPQDPPVIGDGA